MNMQARVQHNNLRVVLQRLSVSCVVWSRGSRVVAPCRPWRLADPICVAQIFWLISSTMRDSVLCCGASTVVDARGEQHRLQDLRLIRVGSIELKVVSEGSRELNIAVDTIPRHYFMCYCNLLFDIAWIIRVNTNLILFVYHADLVTSYTCHL